VSETKSSRKLGRRQAEALALLKEHGTYSKGCGWKYNSHSESVEIYESLVGRGFVSSIANDDGQVQYTFVSEPEVQQEESPAPNPEVEAVSETPSEQSFPSEAEEVPPTFSDPIPQFQ